MPTPEVALQIILAPTSEPILARFFKQAEVRHLDAERRVCLHLQQKTIHKSVQAYTT